LFLSHKKNSKIYRIDINIKAKIENVKVYENQKLNMIYREILKKYEMYTNMSKSI